MTTKREKKKTIAELRRNIAASEAALARGQRFRPVFFSGGVIDICRRDELRDMRKTLRKLEVEVGVKG